MDYNLYYGVKSNRLLIVSNRAPEFTTAVKNTLPGVFVVRYNYDTSSLDDIISKVDDKMQHRKVKNIAILVHSDETQFYICSADDKVLNGDSIIDDPDINYFIKSLSEYCQRGSSRLDFFNSRLASSCVKYQLCEALRHLTQCDVGIWDDLTGEEYFGELYFNSTNTRPTRTALDGYQRIRTVGKGAFGVATLYRNTNKNNLVVIKQINMLDMTAQERQLALNEAKVLSLLNHPNIISYYGSFEMDGVLMIEMEYADGGTLAEYLIGHKAANLLPERQILEMFLQMSKAIQCIHQRNILHRDLKTTNVFLTRDRRVKLGDFGISKIMTTKLQALTVVGTPYYISPEMCEGKQYDQKSDIWALGCILYEMTTLQRTFDASNLPALIHFITKESFAPIPLSYSSNLKRLVNDLLQKDPFRRPDANYLVETVPDFIEFIADSNLIEDTFELSTDSQNRSVVYQFSSPTDLEPVHLPFRVQILQLAVSQTHFVALTNDYSVYTWGEDKHGQLGHGEETPWKNDPQCTVSLLDKHITQVGAGQNFSVFVSSTGLVMTTGDGKYGALGHGDWNSLVRPKLIEFLLKVDVVKISCGNHHLVALTNEGQLYAWGRGNYGQLGLGHLQDCCFPILVNWHLDENISSIQCGPDCTAIVTEHQNVYACGLNKCNKLGLNRPSLFKLKFKEVLFESLFTKIKFLEGLKVANVCFGECHGAAITSEGHVVIWGSNIYSQRGKPHVSQNKPNLLRLPGYSKAQIIACGPTYTLIGTDDNAVVFCGTRFCMDTKAITQMTSMFTSEVITRPKVILGLYATNEQIDKGQLLVLNSLQAVGHNLMITVDTFLRVIKDILLSNNAFNDSDEYSTSDESDDSFEDSKYKLNYRQKPIVEWMVNGERQKPHGGIIATAATDIIYNKFQVIKGLFFKSKPSYSDDLMSDGDTESDGGIPENKGRTLILCSKSNMSRWVNCIKNTISPGILDICVHNGKCRNQSIEELCQRDIVITTVSILSRSDFRHENTVILNNPSFNIQWDRIILDDPLCASYDFKRNTSRALCQLKGICHWAFFDSYNIDNVNNKHAFSLIKFINYEPFNNFEVWKKWFKKNPSVSVKKRFSNIIYTGKI